MLEAGADAPRKLEVLVTRGPTTLAGRTWRANVDLAGVSHFDMATGGKPIRVNMTQSLKSRLSK